MQVDGDARAYDALSQHPRIADLAAITHALLKAAAEARRAAPAGDDLARLASERSLSRDDAGTAFGNALDVLGRGPSTADEEALARALAAHALAAYPPTDPASARVDAAHWIWLAARTPFDALPLSEPALGDRAPALWTAVTDVLRGGLAQALGPPPVSPASSPAPSARRPRAPAEPLRGQMVAAPRGRATTAVLGLTGLLLVEQGVRLFGRFALQYRTPAEIAISDDGGVRVRWRVEMLGRTLRDRDVFVPREALARATREVRFSGAALYAGLFALASGSYVGVSAFVDGVRAASAGLLAAGLAVVAVGLGLDFLLSCILPGARGRCRLVVAPRRGPKLCVGDVDKARADAMLGHLAHG